MAAEIDHVPNIDITVKRDTLVDDMFTIYSQLFKDEVVTKDQISFEELCGGYVNAIWKVSPKENKGRALVFRTFGFKFDEKVIVKKLAEYSENGESSGEKKEQEDPLFYSRLSEYQVMQVVSKHGLCPPVYAKYKNGLVYGFTEGVTVTGEFMLTNDFLNEAAIQLARFHSIKYEIPGGKFRTHLERLEQQFGPPFRAMLKEAEDKLEQEGFPFPYNEIPRIQEQFDLEKKIASLWKEAGPGRIIFSHNDCNQKNLIWNPQTRRLGFIDFEITMANPPEFDLGILMACFAGHFLYYYNKDLFPSEDYRRCFIRRYLEEFYQLNGLDAKSEEFETELEDLFHRTNLITILMLLRWTGFGAIFDFNKSMFQNQDFAEQREKDKYFCGKFCLKIYELFKDLHEPFYEDAKRHFAKRKQVSS